MAVLTIGNWAAPTPSSMQIGVSDISSDNAGRNAAGEMLKDKITQKVKLSCTWDWLENAQCSALLQAVDPIYFSVTYPDPKTGANRTATMYCGDRTAPVYQIKNDVPGWKDVSFDLIEK